MFTVRRRCVFYVSGFDPKGAAFYHGLYREQAALQSTVNGMRIEVGLRQRLPGGNSFWDVKAEPPEGTVHTHYELMCWDDIVRAHWPKGQLHLWWMIFTTTLFYLRTGTLWRMFTLSWPIAVAAFMPFFLLCCLAVGLPVAAVLVHFVAFALTGQSAAATVLAGLSAFGLLALAHRLEGRYSLYWMMRSFAFTARQAKGQLPELEQRLDALATRMVEEAQNGAYDEVMVVGHSSGAIMAAVILARALRQMPQVGSGSDQKLSLLTLGQCIPLLALLPEAQGLRRELALLGSIRHLDWIDFSAPPDGCCFPLVDPLGSCGLTPVAGRPKLLSPRFAEMFDAASYQTLRTDKMKMHFQYLRASQRPTDYDYFLITAGEQTLAGRFASQPGVLDYAGLRPLKSVRHS